MGSQRMVERAVNQSITQKCPSLSRFKLRVVADSDDDGVSDVEIGIVSSGRMAQWVVTWRMIMITSHRLQSGVWPYCSPRLVPKQAPTTTNPRQLSLSEEERRELDVPGLCCTVTRLSKATPVHPKSFWRSQWQASNTHLSLSRGRSGAHCLRSCFPFVDDGHRSTLKGPIAGGGKTTTTPSWGQRSTGMDWAYPEAVRSATSFAFDSKTGSFSSAQAVLVSRWTYRD